MNKKHTFNYALVNKIIEVQGIDPRDIADNCEITRETLRRALLGKANLSKPVIALMANYLSVSKFELFTEGKKAA